MESIIKFFDDDECSKEFIVPEISAYNEETEIEICNDDDDEVMDVRESRMIELSFPAKSKVRLLRMDLDPKSEIRNTSQEYCMRFVNFHRFYISPDRVTHNIPVECSQRISNEFMIGNDPSCSPDKMIRLYDSNVSPKHALIKYRDSYFGYMTFLSSYRRERSGLKSIIFKVPVEIHLRIASYLGRRHNYSIQDLGSKMGTYREISGMFELSSNQRFMVAFEAEIRVIRTVRFGYLYIDEESKRTIWMLWKYENVIIRGLSQNMEEDIYSSFSTSSISNSSKWKGYLDLSCPYAQIEKMERGKLQRYLIIGRVYKSDFMVGRGSNSDILFESILCSRNHCTISLSSGRWYISNGKNSLYGVWLDMRRLGSENEVSGEVMIENGSIYSIGDFFYRFTYLR